MAIRLLVAPDSFKGTFEATEVAEAIAAGAEAAGCEAERCPVGDGGEGTAAVLVGAMGGEWRRVTVHDPLRRPVEARFALLGDGETAALDMAVASGLPLVAPDERDAERADTFGTGELIAAAIEAGARRVLVAAGGSASTDGGRGAIEALRESGGVGGASLEVLCDVTTPFERAARVFAPQKGADEEAVERLSARLDDFARSLPRDPRGVPMGGCAGGLSGGLMAAFDAKLRSGADYVLEAIGFQRRLLDADAVIAGEGKFDHQSLEGKVVGVIAERCAAAPRPLHLIVGCNALAATKLPADAILSVREASTLEGIEEAAKGLAGRLAGG